jgi:hypothetical protein
VLSEAEALHETTGYDAAYDVIMFGRIAADDLDYSQIEADYAAAELAAAFDATNEEAFFRTTPEPFTRGVESFAPWVTERLNSAGRAVADNFNHYQRAYAPILGAAHGRWTEHLAPQLRLFPRPPKTARKYFLHRQQASASLEPRVTWQDYLEFADRQLGPSRQVTNTQRGSAVRLQDWLSSPAGLLAEACELTEKLLHGASEQLQRVARQPEDDEIWRTR